MLNIRKGSHVELQRYFTLLEMDFDSRELLPKLALHTAISKGNADFLVIYEEESGLDAAFALVLGKNLYGYALLKYMAVLPWYRGHGMGLETMRLINRYYSEKQGLIAEVTGFRDEAGTRRLKKFLSRFGYEEIQSEYYIGGEKAAVMVKPLKGKSDISPIAHRVMFNFYSNVLGPAALRRMIEIRKASSME